MAASNATKLSVTIPANSAGLSILELSAHLAAARNLSLRATIIEDTRLMASATLPFTAMVSCGGSVSEQFDIEQSRRSMRIFRRQAMQLLERSAPELTWSLLETDDDADDDATAVEAVAIDELASAHIDRPCCLIVRLGGPGQVVMVDDGSGSDIALQVAFDIARRSARHLRIVTSPERLLDIDRELAKWAKHRPSVDIALLTSGNASDETETVLSGSPAFVIFDQCTNRDRRQRLTAALESRKARQTQRESESLYGDT